MVSEKRQLQKTTYRMMAYTGIQKFRKDKSMETESRLVVT